MFFSETYLPTSERWSKDEGERKRLQKVKGQSRDALHLPSESCMELYLQMSILQTDIRYDIACPYE